MKFLITSFMEYTNSDYLLFFPLIYSPFIFLCSNIKYKANDLVSFFCPPLILVKIRKFYYVYSH